MGAGPCPEAGEEENPEAGTFLLKCGQGVGYYSVDLSAQSA